MTLILEGVANASDMGLSELEEQSAIKSVMQIKKGNAVSKSDFDRVVESIDANLPYLHSERWAREAAALRETVRTTDGPDKESAKQALREHYKTEHHPEASRDLLVRQAMENLPTQQRS